MRKRLRPSLNYGNVATDPLLTTTQIIITNMPKHSIYATLVRVAMAGVIFLSFPLVFINMKQVCVLGSIGKQGPSGTAALCMGSPLLITYIVRFLPPWYISDCFRQAARVGQGRLPRSV